MQSNHPCSSVQELLLACWASKTRTMGSNYLLEVLLLKFIISQCHAGQIKMKTQHNKCSQAIGQHISQRY